MSFIIIFIDIEVTFIVMFSYVLLVCKIKSLDIKLGLLFAKFHDAVSVKMDHCKIADCLTLALNISCGHWDFTLLDAKSKTGNIVE